MTQGRARLGVVVKGWPRLSETFIAQELVALEEANGEISGCAVIMRDLSTEQRMQALISFKASHDELTGLVNRREFEHRLHELLLRKDSTRQAGSASRSARCSVASSRRSSSGERR